MKQLNDLKCLWSCWWYLGWCLWILDRPICQWILGKRLESSIHLKQSLISWLRLSLQGVSIKRACRFTTRPWVLVLSCSMPSAIVRKLRRFLTTVRSWLLRPSTLLAWIWCFMGSRLRTTTSATTIPLDEDWPTTEPTDFDGVLMNPPYSLKWSADSGFLQDPRFSSYGVLAPKSKADFAFLLHGFYHLKHNGVMAIVLPHGVLFRGAAEQKIRQHLLEEGAIDTVIGLPANIFYNTSIPTTIIILKKNRTNKDVFFYRCLKRVWKREKSKQYDRDHIAKILETYQKRENVEKFCPSSQLWRDCWKWL